MPATQAILSFNAGELTPYLRHRTDFDKQSSGAELMQNFIAMPFGGVRKRPGTRHVAQLAGRTRLETFQFNAEDSFVLAFTATTLTIFNQYGAVVQTLTPDPVATDLLEEIPTHFLPGFGDPFLLQFAQVNDVVFITSQEVSPKQLLRTATGWTLRELPFSYPAFLETNRDENWKYNVHLTEAVAAWTDSPFGGTYAVGTLAGSAGRVWECYVAHDPSKLPFITSNEPGVGPKYRSYWREYFIAKDGTGTIGTAVTNPPFNADHIGAYYEISRRRAFDQFEVSMVLQSPTVAPSFSPQIVIKGQWSLATTGIWHGTVYIQRSFDNGGTWEDFLSYTSNNDQNFSSSGYEERRSLYRLRYYFDPADESQAQGSAPRGTLTSEEPYITSLIRITGFSPGAGENRESRSVTFKALDDIDFGETDIWREGAFSRYQGYPAAIAVHERRLIFAGTKRHAVSVWTSKTDDLLNFTPGSTEADASIFITLAATRQDPIRWVASQRRLVIGTAGSEWVFGSDTSDAALSPANLLARQYTYFGSAQLPALTMQSGVFFIERQGRRLRELAYQIDQESYDAADLTRLAEHITESGLVQTAWQGNREPALWAVRADGVMVHFTYIRSEKVAAWSRHTTQGGDFQSVAVVRNQTGDDEVYVVVLRGDQYHLEYFSPGQQLVQEKGSLTGCYHVDSGVRGGTDGQNQIDTPPHLDGRELEVLADGYHLKLTPAGGKITLPFASSQVSAGLAVESRLITLPPEIQTDQGMTHGKLKRANNVKLSLYQSYGGSLIYRGQASDVTTTAPDTPLDAPPPLATGWYEMSLGGGYEQDLQFEIRHASPHPYTVRAAAVEWSVSEGR